MNNFTNPTPDTTIIEVWKNAVFTGMTCQVTTNGNGASCSDTADTFTVQGGDYLSINFSETSPNGTITNSITTKLICQ